MKFFQNVCITPQPCHSHFWLLVAANLAQTWFLGWKWSLWSVMTWLAVQLSKAVFYLILYDIFNDMKLFRNVCIAPQACHSHFCFCWLLPIWPKLDFWAENGAYGLCRLGWRYNGENMYFYWHNMTLLMIWNTSEMSALHLRCSTAIFVVDCCQFFPNRMFGLKMELMACADLVGRTMEQSCVFPVLIW